LKDRPSGINFIEFGQEMLVTLLAPTDKLRKKYLFSLYDVDGDG
jgi:hypothetical protein